MEASAARTKDTAARGVLAVLLGATTIGLAPIFVRWAVPASALVVGFYRMLFALPFACTLALADRTPWDKRGLAWAALAGACFFGDLSLWHTSIRLTNASIATLFVCLAPFWVAVSSSLALGKRMLPLGWLGLVLAVGGAGVLAFARTGAALDGVGLGELAGIGASFCYAGYTLALSRARETLSTAKALAPSIVAATLLFGTSGALAGDAFGGFPDATWLSLLALGLVVQTLAWLFISWGLGHVDTRIGALGLLVQPVSTVVLGYLLLGESLNAPQWVGAAMVMGGIAIVSNPSRVLADDSTRA